MAYSQDFLNSLNFDGKFVGPKQEQGFWNKVPYTEFSHFMQRKHKVGKWLLGLTASQFSNWLCRNHIKDYFSDWYIYDLPKLVKYREISVVTDQYGNGTSRIYGQYTPEFFREAGSPVKTLHKIVLHPEKDEVIYYKEVSLERWSE